MRAAPPRARPAPAARYRREAGRAPCRRAGRANSARSRARRRGTRGGRRPSRTRCAGPAVRDGRRRPAARCAAANASRSVVAVGVVRPVRPVQERLVVALELVVEDDPRRRARRRPRSGGLGLVQPIELGVVRRVRAASPGPRETPAAARRRARGAPRAAPCRRASARRRRVGSRLTSTVRVSIRPWSASDRRSPFQASAATTASAADRRRGTTRNAPTVARMRALGFAQPIDAIADAAPASRRSRPRGSVSRSIGRSRAPIGPLARLDGLAAPARGRRRARRLGRRETSAHSSPASRSDRSRTTVSGVCSCVRRGRASGRCPSGTAPRPAR